MAKHNVVFSKLPKGKDLDISDLEESLDVSKSTIRRLASNKRISRKHDGKKYIYDRKSVQSFMQSFNRDDYYSVAEATQVLKDNGIWDTFKNFTPKKNINNKAQFICEYKRFTDDFPISVTQLLKHGYLKKDKDLRPVMITKSSMIDTIKKLKQSSNNIHYKVNKKSA